MAHNYYQTRNPSGENISFEAEVALLRRYGHNVVTYTRHNDEILEYGFWRKLGLAKQTVWAGDTYSELGSILTSQRIDLAHFQNTFPLISPSAYRACREARVPIVQTLRNYRLMCLNGLLYRKGGTCELCVGRTVAWPGVFYACYRGSRPASGVVAGMLALHQLIGTWSESIDIYVALTEFAKEKFVQGGLPAAKVVVKPNFVDPDPGQGAGSGGYALFVGRLSQEKGVDVLLAAWEGLAGRIPLRGVGDGPLWDTVSKAAVGLEGVNLMGRQEP